MTPRASIAIRRVVSLFQLGMVFVLCHWVLTCSESPEIKVCLVALLVFSLSYAVEDVVKAWFPGSKQ